LIDGKYLMSTTVTRDLTIDSEHGLHLRSAAMFAKAASQFDADIQASHGPKTVNAKSTVGLLTLGAPQAGLVRVVAVGVDADSALDALEALVRDDAFVHQSVA
jgi:phosphotransferase system HPr (HPr) family protein